MMKAMTIWLDCRRGRADAVASMHPYNFVAQENPIYQQYTVLPPLTGPEGVSFAKYTGGQMPGAAFAITNKADKDQQIAAIKLADYLATDEGTTRGTRGIEGVNWALGGDKDIDLNGNKAKYTPLVTKPDDPKAQNNAWSEVGPFVKTKAYRTPGRPIKMNESGRVRTPFTECDETVRWTPAERNYAWLLVH